MRKRNFMLLLTVVLTFLFIMFMRVNGYAQTQDRTSTKEIRVLDSNNVPQVTNANITTSLPGTRSLYYWIVSTDANGNKSLPSGPFVAKNSPTQFGSMPDGSYYFNSTDHKLYLMTLGTLVEFTAATYTYGGTTPTGACTASNGFVNTTSGVLYICTPPAPNRFVYSQPVFTGLDHSRYANTITWQPVAGAVSYDVLRTTSNAVPTGACNCAVITGVKITKALDNVETLNAYTVNASGSDFVETNERNASGLSTKTTRYNGSIVFSVDANGNVVAKGNMNKPSVLLGLTECYFNVAYGLADECPADVGNKAKSGGLWRQTIRDPQNPTIAKSYFGVEVYQDARSGGINQSSPSNIKTNWDTLIVGQRSWTPGQHQAITAVVANYSFGDAFAIVGNNVCAGSIVEGGDEGCVGLASYAYQSNEEFNATVTTVAGNVVNYSGANSENTRGERRLLIATNRAVYSTGTVSAISSHTVTGSGTNWATQFGSGAKTKLCFSLDGGNADNSLLYVLPVASITNENTLVLGDSNWAGDATTGTYKIFSCSTVTAVADTGSVTVADGTAFQANDVIRMPLGNSLDLISARLQVKRTIPGGKNTSALLLNNIGTRTFNSALQVSGPFSTLLDLYPVNGGALLKSNGATSGLWTAYNTAENANVNIASINRNAADTGQATFSLDKSTKQFQMVGASLAVTSGAAAGSNGVVATFTDTAGAPRLIVKEGLNGFAMGKPTYWWSDNQGTMTAEVFGNTGAAIFRDVKLTGGAQPTCNSSARGQLWYAPGATGVKDTVNVCTKDAADAYAWRVIY